jgi:3-isopropylmalate/(R)-2-methylmalate dehydratase large subunit
LGKTIAEKILSAKSKKDVRVGEIVEANVDYVMVNDITGPAAFDEFEGLCAPILKDRIVLIPDHYVPNKDVASAKQAKKMRDFTKKHGIKNYFEVGSGGVCHQLMIEKGFVARTERSERSRPASAAPRQPRCSPEASCGSRSLNR